MDLGVLLVWFGFFETGFLCGTALAVLELALVEVVPEEQEIVL